MAQTQAPKEDLIAPAYVETVEEIMKIYKSLPPRPSLEEVEAAMTVIRTASAEEQSRLEEIDKQVPPPPGEVPPDLFSVLQEVRKNMVVLSSCEQMKESMHLVQVDRIFHEFDQLIQTASGLVSGATQMEKLRDFDDTVGEFGRRVGGHSVTYDKRVDVEPKSTTDGLSKIGAKNSAILSSGSGESEKLSLMKVAAIIENIAKTEETVLDLHGKLMDKVEWLPLSLGKLSKVIELNFSGNRIMALPNTIGRLNALTKLDIHSNQLINLPDSVGDLVNLTALDLHANKLKSLPDSLGKLTKLSNLDLSLNQFTTLPDVIGSLSSLTRLNVTSNELEELPHTIGSCLALSELRLDFNQLKALPEAVGKLERLEILTLHYNRIRRLPTTVGNFSCLRELDACFNELESIPDCLCFATNLRRLNVSMNFADLRTLPEFIGNLDMLEEIDISSCQIKELPDSFRFLSKLKVFQADDTPLEVPPMQIAKLGVQAVMQYMDDYVANKAAKLQRPKKKKGLCSLICPLFWL